MGQYIDAESPPSGSGDDSNTRAPIAYEKKDWSLEYAEWGIGTS